MTLLPAPTRTADWLGLALPRWPAPSWALEGLAVDERMAERYAESLAADEPSPSTRRLPQ